MNKKCLNMKPEDYRIQPAPDAHSVGAIGTDQTGDWGGIRCDFFNRKTFPMDFCPSGRSISFSAPYPKRGLAIYLIPLAAWQAAMSIKLNSST